MVWHASSSIRFRRGVSPKALFHGLIRTLPERPRGGAVAVPVAPRVDLRIGGTRNQPRFEELGVSE